jgi:hypothetical protein
MAAARRSMAGAKTSHGVTETCMTAPLATWQQPSSRASQGVEREDAQDLDGRAAQVRQVGEVVLGAVERRRRHAGGLEAPGQLGGGQQAPAGRGSEPEAGELRCAGVQQRGHRHVLDPPGGRGTEQIGDQELVVDGVQRSAAGLGRSLNTAGHERAASASARAK